MSTPFLGKALSNTPTPVKAILAVATGGSIVGALVAFRNSPAFWVVAIGIVVVLVLLIGYRLVLKFLEKRKANPLTQRISQNSAAAPQAISEPAKRARLDDLRKSFETGVEKFRAAGKNLYAVPWYLLVGEPGSGKTEAIRHCNVGFPPGLQDQLQGAGGTLNMNWWFTNHAVILDTAGRLMFEEAPPGQTTEWHEFLKMLRASRPNCPVNGMLLVIPCDSLICDTADEIERKAGKVAQQLDQIQRSLGVRFPVFVVVTKCDLINGFREFFDDLDDPRLQHQILGWSNPATLDEPFRPEQVEEHLSQVRQRMMRRRMVMLQDPVHTEDPAKRRIDQVDALYAFPESIMQVAPRLRRYLEMIFVAGEWSSKPLFLRGIYMTSSMREGSALDAELAESLGVSVESLPEGRVWERDRAFFLRDLFMSKIFKEKGLVTRAGNVLGAQRRRRAILLGAIGGTIALLFGLGLLGVFAFKASVGKQIAFWAGAADQMADDQKNNTGSFMMLKEVRKGDSDFRFNGSTELARVPEKPTLLAFYEKAARTLKENDIRVPAPFKIVPGLIKNIGEGRAEAVRTLIECCILRKAVNRAQEKLAKPDQDWGDAETQALASLIRLHGLAGVAPKDAHRPPGDEILKISDLYQFVTTADAFGPLDSQGHREANPPALVQLQAIFDEPTLRSTWVLNGAATGTGPDNENALMKCVDQFIAYWSSTRVRVDRFRDAGRLASAMEDFKSGESDIIKLYKEQAPDPLAEHDAFREKWSAAFVKLDHAAGDADPAFQSLAQLDTPEAIADAAKVDVSKAAQSAFQKLLAQASSPGGAAGSSKLADKLSKASADLTTNVGTQIGSIRQRLVDLPFASYASKPQGAEAALYRIRTKVYTAADTAARQLSEVKTFAPGDFNGALESADAAIKSVQAAADAAKIAAPQDKLREGAERVSVYAVQMGKRALAYNGVKSLLEGGETFAQRATNIRELKKFDSLKPPQVPLSTLQDSDSGYTPEFDHRAARLLLADWARAAKLIQDGAVPESSSLSQSFDKEWGRFTDYATAYVNYWSDTVPNVLGAVPQRAWTEQLDRMSKTQVSEINRNLTELLGQIKTSLEAAKAALDSSPSKRVDQLQKSLDIDSKLKRVNDELARLGTSADDCKAIRAKWLSLDKDARTARGVLVTLTPQELRDDFLHIYDADKGVRFWNSLCLNMLVSLANFTETEGTIALKGVKDKYLHFPLVNEPPGPQSLNPEQLTEAATLIGKIPVLLPAGAGGAIKAVGQGAPYNDKLIDEQLKRLTGATLLRSDSERTWCQKLSETAAFLSGPSKPCDIVICEQSTVGKDVPGKTQASEFYAEVELTFGKATDRKKFQTRFRTDDSVRVTMPGDPLIFKFRPTGDDDPKHEEFGHAISMPDHWSVWALLHSPGAFNDPAAWNGKGVVRVPLLVESLDRKPQQYFYWIGLHIDGQLPDPSRWPGPNP